MKKYSYVALMLMFATASAYATVTVNSPANDETTGTTVQFVASASTSCSRGVSSMGIYVDDNREYVADGARLNATLTLGQGTHKTVVEEWDGCGGASTASRTITVTAQNGVSVKIEELLLAAGKSTHVHNLLGVDAHSLERWAVGDRGDDESTEPL